MSMDAALKEMFNRTVTISAFSAYDVGGAPSYSTGVEYPGRVERTSKLVKDDEGRDVVATTIIYVAPNSKGNLPNADSRDKVTLDDSTTVDLISVERYDDLTGVHHEVLNGG